MTRRSLAARVAAATLFLVAQGSRLHAQPAAHIAQGVYATLPGISFSCAKIGLRQLAVAPTASDALWVVTEGHSKFFSSKNSSGKILMAGIVDDLGGSRVADRGGLTTSSAADTVLRRVAQASEVCAAGLAKKGENLTPQQSSTAAINAADVIRVAKNFIKTNDDGLPPVHFEIRPSGRTVPNGDALRYGT